jgi:hypothetical protein
MCDVKFRWMGSAYDLLSFFRRHVHFDSCIVLSNCYRGHWSRNSTLIITYLALALSLVSELSTNCFKLA